MDLIRRMAPLLALPLLCCGGEPEKRGEPPRASLIAPAYVDVGTTALLDASQSTDPDGDIARFRFIVADGTAGRWQSAARVEHTFQLVGLIEVAVEVVDSEDSTSRARQVVSVRRP